ncbi:MAG: hypothetical protein H7Z14_00490 [Anaerolineae bacterium]|nr:hypothetical protein [Phycisphaerae bacterium]
MKYAICAALALVLAALGWIVGIIVLGPSITVAVTNQGPAVMRSVTVLLGGKAVSIGDIPVGLTRTARVRPEGDSGVEIRFINSSGDPSSLIMGTYISNGFGGDIHITIANEKVTATKVNIGPRLF